MLSLGGMELAAALVVASKAVGMPDAVCGDQGAEQATASPALDSDGGIGAIQSAAESEEEVLFVHLLLGFLYAGAFARGRVRLRARVCPLAHEWAHPLLTPLAASR